MTAYLAMASFTLTETLRALEPLGVDRSALELTHRYGIRDTLTCPVAGRWIVVFWSKELLAKTLTSERRGMLFMAATLSAIKLQKLTSLYEQRLGGVTNLTAREISVMHRLSLGKRTKEIAEDIKLSEETVRSHIKKAQAKWKAHSQTHAVAEAIRHRFIP